MSLQLQSCCTLFKLWRYQKIAFVTFHCVKNTYLFTTTVVFFLLEESYLLRIRLDMKSNDFVCGEILNTTNAVRSSVVMFSRQPFLSLKICRFFARFPPRTMTLLGAHTRKKTAVKPLACGSRFRLSFEQFMTSFLWSKRV